MTPFSRGAIAAGHPKTAEAGLEMLLLGGNVFDAVVAAALAACVAEPGLTSLGGGGFLLAHTQTGEDILFDFFTQTPKRRSGSFPTTLRQGRGEQAAIDFYPVGVNFGSVVQEFHVGLGSMAVPGNVAGLFHVHRRLGRLPFQTVAEPAIHYARAGVELTEFQAYCFKILSPILLASDEMRQICAPSGQLSLPGTQIAIPALADTLAFLAVEGPQGFYEGEIGQQLVRDCAARGGYLTKEDLQSYRVLERQPLRTRYRGKTLLTNPPPSSGGTLIAFALKLLETVPLAELGWGSWGSVRAIAQTMRQTNLARSQGYDTHLYDPGIAQDFLSAHNLETYAAPLQPAPPVNKWGSTTHISAIDGEGNAASLTTSNGEGSSYVIPGTGIMVNNMLGEADLHPGGFHQWQEDVRISSMMAPTIVLRDNQPAIVLGSGGSNRIRTAILQVICNILDFQQTVDTAVNHPRIHWENGVLNLEPGYETLLQEARQEGNGDRPPFPFDQQLVQWDAPNMFFGGVHTVMQNAAGEISGAGDGRRSGAMAIL